MRGLADAVLLAAETIRENPERWTHGDYFRNRHGDTIHADAPLAACQACAVGMVVIAAHTLGVDFMLGADDLDRALNEATDSTERTVEEFNDYLATGPDEVADVLEKIAAVL